MAVTRGPGGGPLSTVDSLLQAQMPAADAERRMNDARAVREVMTPPSNEL
jgi:hypothetical protein